jgi:hypothetical protein
MPIAAAMSDPLIGKVAIIKVLRTRSVGSDRRVDLDIYIVYIEIAYTSRAR